MAVGSEVDAILLDCQGLSLNDGQTKEMCDSEAEEKLFTLAILLASQLVFNTKGHITDQTMDELAWLPVLANKIRVRETARAESDCKDDDGFSSDDEGDSAEFYKFFP